MQVKLVHSLTIAHSAHTEAENVQPICSQSYLLLNVRTSFFLSFFVLLASLYYAAHEGDVYSLRQKLREGVSTIKCTTGSNNYSAIKVQPPNRSRRGGLSQQTHR